MAGPFSFLPVFDVLLERRGRLGAGPGLDDSDGQTGCRQKPADGPAVLLCFDRGGDTGPVIQYQLLPPLSKRYADLIRCSSP